MGRKKGRSKRLFTRALRCQRIRSRPCWWKKHTSPVRRPSWRPERSRRCWPQPQLLLVDVREAYEQWLGKAFDLGAAVSTQAVLLSNLAEAMPARLTLPAHTPVVFFCHSGNAAPKPPLRCATPAVHKPAAWPAGRPLWPRCPARPTLGQAQRTQSPG